MKPGCTCDGTHAEIQQEPPTQGSRRLSLFQLLFSYVLTCEKEVRSGSDLSLGLLAIHVALDSQSSSAITRIAVTPQATYMAVFQIGVATFGSPSAYCQLLAAVYRILWAAVRMAFTEVADLSVMCW